METINVVHVSPKKQGTSKTGKPWTISEVTDDQGRKFDTFDAFKEGDTAEVEIIPPKDPKYNQNIKRARKQNDYQNSKNAEQSTKILDNNSDKEQRITMLSCISSSAQYYQQREASKEQMKEFAKELFHLAMTHKLDQIPF